MTAEIAAAPRHRSSDRSHEAAFFHFRTPLLAFDDYARFAEECAAEAARNGGDADAALFDVALQRFSDPLLEEALWLASPDLAAEVRAAARKRVPQHGRPLTRDERRLAYALHRYLNRAATRPTPFGLFAGAAVGEVAEETALRLGATADAHRHVEVDSEVVVRFAERWSRDRNVVRHATLSTAPTIYPEGSAYRYITYEEKGRGRAFALRKVRRDAVVDWIVERAAGGATFEALAGGIAAAAPGLAIADIEDYLHQLVRNGILIPDFLPRTSGDSFARLHETAEFAGEDGERLRRVRSNAAWLSRQPLGIGCGAYEALAADAEEESAPAKTPPFRVNLVKSCEATLSDGVTGQVLDAVRLLALVPRSKDAGMEHLRARFQERYGQRLVPLMEVADEESGILASFAASADLHDEQLLGGIPFGSGREDDVTLSPWEMHLLQRVAALEGNELVVDEAELRGFTTGDAALPPSFAAMIRLLEPRGDGSWRLYVQSAGGSSGLNLLTRFCAADGALASRVRDFAQKENEQGGVIAEVLHLPNARALNVTTRPLLRDYEIPLTAPSTLPRERQLPPSELHVGAGPDGFFLWSERLQQRVTPRLTTAHAYASAGQLRLYKFLASIQEDARHSFTWRWGALERLPRLPRVRIGDAIVARARWLLDPSALNDALAGQRLPRWVTMTEGDNELLFDLHAELGRRTLLDTAAGKERIELHEALPAPDSLAARGPEGGYVHEIVLPFVAARPQAPRAPRATRPRTAATAHPGSRCAYLKLYTAPSLVDDLLLDRVAPAAQALQQSGAIERWFFIRYSDPEWHLRVRLFCSEDGRWTDAASSILDAVREELGDGRVWRTQIDAYEPEIERYGGPETFPGIERWFSADSAAAVATLAELRASSLLPERWKAALASMHGIVDGAGLPLDRRIDLFAYLERNFQAELGGSKATRDAVLARMRRDKRELERILFGDAGEIWRGIAERSRRNGEALRAIAGGAELLPDLLHMTANRLLRHNARPQEMVLYSYLNRLYEGARARQRSGP